MMALPRPTLLHSNISSGIQHELMCIICHDIPVEVPLITTQCLHAFCGSCIRQVLERNAACPVCQTPVTEHELSPISGLVRRMWEQVRVKCPSCEWTGNIGNYEAHRERSCTTTTAGEEMNALKRKCDKAMEKFDLEKRQRIRQVNNLEMELRKARTELAEALAEVEEKQALLDSTRGACVKAIHKVHEAKAKTKSRLSLRIHENKHCELGSIDQPGPRKHTQHSQPQSNFQLCQTLLRRLPDGL
jgi:hypothetical protein